MNLCGAFSRAQGFLLFFMALVLPWELFQRLPIVGGTAAKLAGALLLLMGLLRLLLCKPRALPRTRLEGPILLLVAACLLATAHSIDRAASLALLQVYGAYLLFFYAAAKAVGSPIDARRYGAAFIASSAAVAVLTLACRAGWLYPTWWQPLTIPWTGRLIDVARAGGLMRMAGASADLNQGVLPLLLAFALSVFLFDYRALRRPARVGLHAAQVLLVLGMAIAQSRSSLLCAAIVVLIPATRGLRQYIGTRRFMALFALGIAAGAIVALFGLHRIVVRDDLSVHSRMMAYRAGIALLPQYALLGAGFNASDAAIAQTPYDAETEGQTIHNVPLKFLLETGVLGFAAYLWLWFTIVAAPIRCLRASGDPALQRLARAFLAASGCLFAVTLVQPFMATPVYPFLLAMAMGPLSMRREAEPEWRMPRAVLYAAVVLAGLLVACNAYRYQKDCRLVAQFSDALAPVPQAERDGRWADAQAGYKAALAFAAPELGPRLGDGPFYDAQARLFDLPRIYDAMHLGALDVDPEAACRLGVGRVLFSLGNASGAMPYFDAAIAREPEWAGAHYVRAEALWHMERYTDALHAYAEAARLEPLPRNRLHRLAMQRIKDRTDQADRSDLLERAFWLLKRGVAE